MRHGELFRLEWAHIDFERGAIIRGRSRKGPKAAGTRAFRHPAGTRAAGRDRWQQQRLCLFRQGCVSRMTDINKQANTISRSAPSKRQPIFRWMPAACTGCRPSPARRALKVIRLGVLRQAPQKQAGGYLPHSPRMPAIFDRAGILGYAFREEGKQGRRRQPEHGRAAVP